MRLGAPFPSEELSAQVQAALPSKYSTGETVVSRLKCQFDKHCIRFEDILKTTARKKTVGTRIQRTELVMRPS